MWSGAVEGSLARASADHFISRATLNPFAVYRTL